MTRRLIDRRVVAASLVEVLAPAVDMVGDSQVPVGTGTDRRWRWDFGPGAVAALTVTYRLRPAVATYDGVAVTGMVHYTDTLGVSGAQEVPPGRLTIIGPCATPTAPPTATTAPTVTVIPQPTATILPPTATPTATVMPTRAPVPVYLPLTLREECASRHQRADVVLVLDTSGSMAGRKLADAQAVAVAFVALMDFATGRDQVAVMRFDTTAEVVQQLTADRAGP